MPKQFQPHYLTTLRKQWSLSQRELGMLVGLSADAISKWETRERLPSRNALIQLEMVFGYPGPSIFPLLYEELHDEVGRYAATFDKRIQYRKSTAAARQRTLLSMIAKRGLSHPTIYEPDAQN